MNIESFRLHCNSKSGVTEEFPFDENTLVFKVMGKIFAITDIEIFESFNLKCEPARAIELRERYAGIIPGFHMNKKHWNTVLVHSDVREDLMWELIDHSYDLVVAGLPTKLKRALDD